LSPTTYVGLAAVALGLSLAGPQATGTAMAEGMDTGAGPRVPAAQTGQKAPPTQTGQKLPRAQTGRPVPPTQPRQKTPAAQTGLQATATSPVTASATVRAQPVQPGSVPPALPAAPAAPEAAQQSVEPGLPRERPLSEAVQSALLMIRRWFAPDYAAILTGSNWDVPYRNQLAYGAYAATQFNDPIPMGDQTTWGCQLGSNGCTTTSTTGLTVTSAPDSPVTTFVGTATEQSAVLGILTSPSYNSMSGSVSSNGSIVIVFTPTDSSGTPTGDPSTVGFGQMEHIFCIPQMEMQMISNTSLIVTHWAHMTPYSGPNSAAPQPVSKPSTRANRRYSWLDGTQWQIVAPALFGTEEPGTFTISDYSGGYLLGYGQGPQSNPITFSEMGSITPQGMVLFNTMADGSTTFISSYGQLTGFGRNAEGNFADYNSTTGQPTGTVTVISQIPAPRSRGK
jgi:hypothetical protein